MMTYSNDLIINLKNMTTKIFSLFFFTSSTDYNNNIITFLLLLLLLLPKYRNQVKVVFEYEGEKKTSFYYYFQIKISLDCTNFSMFKMITILFSEFYLTKIYLSNITLLKLS